METMNTMDPNAMGAAAAGVGIVAVAIYAVILLFYVIVMWKVYTKGGQPGIASIIPIWNIIALCQMAGKPGWWFILLCIPVVNLVIAIMLLIALAENFGKGTGFAIGLLLLGPIFFPILAFGSAQYGAGESAEAVA
jgi:hypothetical protein